MKKLTKVGETHEFKTSRILLCTLSTVCISVFLGIANEQLIHRRLLLSEVTLPLRSILNNPETPAGVYKQIYYLNTAL